MILKRILAGITTVSCGAAVTVVLAQTPSNELTSEPIAFIGHGAIFDANGREINVTPQFIRETQKYYLNALSSQAAPTVRETLESKRQSLFSVDGLKGQSELLANSLLLDWLLGEVKPKGANVLAGKLGMLKQLVRTRKLSDINQPISTRDVGAFEPPTDVLRRLESAGLMGSTMTLFSTNLGGADYINECNNAGVPIPPDWGDAKWVSKGVLPNEFISAEKEAEVFTYDSAAPEGSCIALPRAIGDTIDLLGIICLGKASSKVCFWDNQRNQEQFPIKKGTTESLRNFAGGADLNGGTGGICTDCHGGENPYIMHPKTTLGLPNLRGLKLRADDWYKPIVHADWPQNTGPSNVLDSVISVGQCTDCHEEAGSGGRFPKLSTVTPGYCSAVLSNAITKTMPPGSPGDPDYAAHTDALLATCKASPE